MAGRRAYKKIPFDAQVAWQQQCTPTLTEFQNDSTIQISAGGEHTFVLTKAGDLWAWGEGNHGQLAAMGTHNERSQGDEVQAVRVSLDQPARQIECGVHHSLAVGYDGQVYIWGDFSSSADHSDPIKIGMIASGCSWNSTPHTSNARPSSPIRYLLQHVRSDMLHEVHQAMDNDQTGYIEATELMLLGQARRKLGHKGGEWTEEQNSALVKELDVSGDGRVEAKEFVEYFNKMLPVDPDEFKEVIHQFMEVAEYCSVTSPPVSPPPSPLASAVPPAYLPEQVRNELLRGVHNEMDSDRSGYIEAAELMLLGQARAQLGHAGAEWSEESNNALLNELDATGDGRIEAKEFFEYFNKVLPEDPEEFREIIRGFMAVAKYCAALARLDKLREVHEAMDIACRGSDRGGYIEATELMLLGQARRKLGQKSDEWTEERNSALVKELDVSGDGRVEAKEFVEYFNKVLPVDPDEFKEVIRQFMEVAEYCATNKAGSDSAEAYSRSDMLREVHQAMDNDQTGYIEATELMLLGQARRKLGHKGGEWTEEQNSALVNELDVSGDGRIGTNEFVEYFDKVLPVDPDEFKEVIQQFMEVAEYCSAGEAEAADNSYDSHIVKELRSKLSPADADYVIGKLGKDQLPKEQGRGCGCTIL